MSGPGRVLLCADDYALTAGVSRAIEELALAGRISATSAIVNTRRWPDCAKKLAALRGVIAVGLHINLTLGWPLAVMPRLCPDGPFPLVGRLTGLAMLRRLDAFEIAAEIERQLAAFESELGFPPDVIDGHQHVHSLPQVRDALIAVLTRRFPAGTMRPLVRHPGDGFAAIFQRGRHVGKALTLKAVSFGFDRALQRAGFPSNDSFAGVTRFLLRDTLQDFARTEISGGRLHLVMCHPGFPDGELAAVDPVIERRGAEFLLLRDGRVLREGMWHPRRTAAGPPVDWQAELAGVQ